MFDPFCKILFDVVFINIVRIENGWAGLFCPPGSEAYGL